ncbi:SNF2-related protein [Criblamydia sequanensis]|uniref:SNF2-family helicase n=1 Tax=Candidatus Criblamydia sequanensis CRIB-18 TaxID=1437425 RepID=A0A090CYM4_9BACT|nr:SNF2-related protein [Criblamydia sequanensis]CDR33581.1 SNF2-family helicase [Criblamydia sequanensis CRIB-18]
MNFTNYHTQFFAHQLTRRFSSNDSQKLASALFDAKVDLNPHQVEAALFAFKSPLSKGAILADEVGLGKTIEAGLVIAQKWSERKRRILIIGPASLRQQWLQEIQEKFYIPAMILEAKNYKELKRNGCRQPFNDSEKEQIIITSYNFAVSKAEDLSNICWDLVVIDEAHRLRNVYKAGNKTGKAIKTALQGSPKILLTATPLQNSLSELYGLVSIIDDHAFGDFKIFNNHFSKLEDSEKYILLKSRLKSICHRTLRRQVREYINYTNRIPILQRFDPTWEEQKLYENVSEYLRRSELRALPPGQKKLMILVYRRLLASSSYAIAGGLNSLIKNLEKQIGIPKKNETLIEEIGQDYESFSETADEWEEIVSDTTSSINKDDQQAILNEINDLKAFRDLAQSIKENSRGRALLVALKTAFSKAKEIGAAEKVIIFTESRKTQNYLTELLSNAGFSNELVLFNGSNTDHRCNEIYKDWCKRNAGSDKVTGLKTSDMRSALVDEFRESAKIMIATEAAAEGINLQFCSIVVNYDLPWNPQKIEQRIGRCHRYGQKHDVVVINFLNEKNAAEERVYELLNEKFKLFEGVFGASDEVLGAIESGVDIEKRIVDIIQNCRTTEEIEEEFQKFRRDVDGRINQAMKDTRKKLLENFDAAVHERLKVNLRESCEYIGSYERLLWDLTRHELKAKADFNFNELSFCLNKKIQTCDEIPIGKYKLGKEREDVHRYRIGHPLAQYLIKQAISRKLPGAHMIVHYTKKGPKSAALDSLVGSKGILGLVKLRIDGDDAEDHLILCGRTDQNVPLTEEQVRRIFDYSATIQSEEDLRWPLHFEEQTKAKRQMIIDQLTIRQVSWFDDENDKLDNWANDQRLSHKANLEKMDDEIKELKKASRQTKIIQDKIDLQRKIKHLDSRRHEAWRVLDEMRQRINQQKDKLLNEAEEKLKNKVTEEQIFILRWELI